MPWPALSIRCGVVWCVFLLGREWMAVRKMCNSPARWGEKGRAFSGERGPKEGLHESLLTVLPRYLEAQMRVAREIMKERRAVLHELAK